MRAVFQRVKWARVLIDRAAAGEIGPGSLILIGVKSGDTTFNADRLARKCAELRVFDDSLGKMNLSLLDTGGAALVVSQFTLYGDCSRGRRPSYVCAARPEEAFPLYERFVSALRELVSRVETGRFGAMMEVELANDGPVTLIVENA